MFLTLTNVGMIMRPDLSSSTPFHFHGYPTLPRSMTACRTPGRPSTSAAASPITTSRPTPDVFLACQLSPEHLQMGMVGQLYVRPRQNRVPTGTTLYAGLQAQQTICAQACRRPFDV